MAEIKTVFREGAGATQVLTVDPNENILIGLQKIQRYLGIRSTTTFIVWVEVFGLPAVKRPDGCWMTSMTAIDQWIWMASELETRQRAFSRGTNERVDIAFAQAARRLERAKRHKLVTGPIDRKNQTPEEIAHYGQALLKAQELEPKPKAIQAPEGADPFQFTLFQRSPDSA